MRFVDIPESDWVEFTSRLYDGEVNSISINKDGREVIVNITTDWVTKDDNGDEEIVQSTDDVTFRVPYISCGNSIDVDWSIDVNDLPRYYEFLYKHNVNPLGEILSGIKDGVNNEETTT